jgi:hypothetical protein
LAQIGELQKLSWIFVFCANPKSEIPLALAFGPAEITDLYASFCDISQSQYQISLDRLIIE